MKSGRVERAHSPAQAITEAVLLMLGISLLDGVTGYEVTVMPLYLIPAALAGWHAGRWAGLAVSAMGAAAWLAADSYTGHPYSHPLIPYWNATARMAIFGIVAVLAAELKRMRDRLPVPRDSDEGITEGASFYRLLEHEHGAVARHGRPVTLAYLDAGAAGEPFAGALVDALQATLRATDVVARPRGREFAVLLVDAGPDAAAVALERIRESLAILASGHDPAPALAMGAVSCTDPRCSLNRLIQRAYQVLYEADRVPGQLSLTLETIAETEPAAC
ncbi:MAG TPA: diguanylate cyclase [Longimicrobium sp.]|nr:diguanylate cyclase [Longimicrobium sp.]